MILIDQRNYKSVAGFTTDQTLDYVVPSGKVLKLTEMGGDSPNNTAVRATIIWDPAGANQIIFNTVMSSVQSILSEFVGDGVKVMRIELDNQTISAKIIGAYFIGELIDE